LGAENLIIIEISGNGGEYGLEANDDPFPLIKCDKQCLITHIKGREIAEDRTGKEQPEQ